jgi:sporulation protein YlmC with PRC-barrel domain
MPDILAENLSGKAIIGSDGKRLGMLYNITMDIKSGELADLLVDPDESVRDLDFEQDDRGHYQIPVSRVQAVKDHIVVRR